MIWRRFPLFFCLLAAVFAAGCQDKDLNSGPTVSDLQPPPPPPPPPPLDPCPNVPTTAELEVVFNEYMFDNVSAHMDPNGNFTPWIELYNTSDTLTFNLGHVTIVKEEQFFAPDLRQEWDIPCIAGAILGPGEHLVIYLDGDTANLDDFHAPITADINTTWRFFLNGGSDTIVTNAADNLPDTAIGRTPDGNSGPLVELETPTPGAANSGPAMPPPPMEIPFVRGDADGNGVVDSADPAAEAAFITGAMDLPNCPDRLDVDDNGVLNISDVTFLAAQVAMPMPMIPPPFPMAGDDQTNDNLDCLP